MTRIRKIEIAHFRGIEHLVWDPTPGINCMIGPGDSGKSTVLDAIDLCLGARRSIGFADTDFFGLDVTQPIRITVTLGELHHSLVSLEAYGPFLRGYRNGVIEDEPAAGAEIVLSVTLTVSGDLEPNWSLTSDRAAQQGLTKMFGWADRLRLAPTRIGAVADYNLAWQRGSVLHRLSEERADASAALVQAVRAARTAFGQQAQPQLAQALATVTQTAQELGVPVGQSAQALLDAHSVSYSGGTIALHSEAGVPLRNMGTGSSRLLVAGLQRKAAQLSSIVLADELEYGLEPHRIARFLGSLGAKEASPLQAFLTTHSPVALRELSSTQLCVVRQAGAVHEVRPLGAGDDIQSTVRLFPEAFLAQSVIVCEGASEVGLLRGLDLYRVSQGHPSLAAMGVALIDVGGGDADRPHARANAFLDLGYRTMILRDDDIPPTQVVEQAVVARGGTVVAYRAGRALEDELFASLPVVGCQALINYAYELHEDLIHAQLATVSNNTLTFQLIWDEIDATQAIDPARRATLGRAARIRKNGWFKSISWMEHAARTIVGPNMDAADAGFRSLMNSVFAWADRAPR